MNDNKKHIIAKCIYDFVKIIKGEFKFAIKPLAKGVIPFVIFIAIAEWSDVIFGVNCKELCISLGLIGLVFPLA